MQLKDLQNLRRKNGYIDISDLTVEKKDSSSPISLEDGKIYWKEPLFNSYSHFTEVLISILCEQINFPCAKYELAQNKNKKGVISYSVENNGFKKILYNDFLNSHIGLGVKESSGSISIQKFYCILDDKLKRKEITKENANELLKDHVKLMIFDSIILNPDRHIDNLLILTDKKQFKLSPAFDHEMSFLSYYNSDLIATYLRNDHFKAVIKKEIYQTDGLITMFDSDSCLSDYLTNLKQTKKAFPGLFESTLKQLLKMDVTKAFMVMEKEQKITLPKDYKDWVSLVYDERIDSIKEYFKQNQDIKTRKDDLQL